GGALWAITIGHASSGEDPGTLHFGETTSTLSVGDVLSVLAHGPHASAFWVADACHPGPAAGRKAGLAAAKIQRRGSDVQAAHSGRNPWAAALAPPPRTAGSEEGLYNDPRSIEHASAAWASPTELTIVTAGIGRACQPDTPADYPWLAYGVLGSLRGWGDDGDGQITVSEAARTAARWQGPHAPGVKVAASGSDLVLAMVDDPEPDPRPEPRARAAALATTRNGAAPTTPELALDFNDRVHLPAGWSRMGCVEGDPDCEPDEKPTRHVFLKQFTIDRDEVTWGQYAECVEAGDCPKVDPSKCYVWTRDRGFVKGVGFDRRFIADDRPVVCVNWRAAHAYCKWSGQLLPTEAQWERAARGDTFTRYPWGDAPPTCEVAQHDGCADTPRAVGTAASESPAGARDMAGNVWEWVADWYQEDTYGARDNDRDPVGPPVGEVRVVRGGSFYDDPTRLRTSYRYGLSPHFAYSNVGFRCRG
ncbi:MAG: SUMF1/EgtB/PvdO family nonheme iron enzyme, partial [Myxococcota bacterium]